MYNKLDAFELEIKNNIRVGNLNFSLDAIIDLVESIVADNRSTGKVYGSATLDRLCQLIGTEALKHQRDYVLNTKPLDSLSIYIATELYDTGGHSAVLEDFIKAAPKRKHLILITDTLNTVKREIIENRFIPLGVTIKWAPKSNSLDKLIWLQSQLIEEQPGMVFLFNHWQDAVAIAAVQASITPKLFFYHHCDHQLCLGLYLSHAQHIDLHSFGFYNCHNLGVSNTLYIPLVAEDLATRSIELPFLVDGKLRTCSSGNNQKFEQPYSYSYVEEIPKIINSTQGVHVHIGYLSTNILNRIRNRLKEQGIPQENFVYIPWVKSLWKAMHDQKIDVYISSFPIFGARASVEVMGSGTPIIGHNNYYSQFLSGVDVIYPEAFFWHKPQELYNYLQSLTPEVLYKQSVYSRKHYERFHTVDVLESCLEKLNSQEEVSLVPKVLRPYSYDQLQAFLDDNTLYLPKQFIDIIDVIYPILDKTKLKLDKSKISDFLYWLTISPANLGTLKLQLENIQNEQAISQTQLQETQVNLEISQTQLQETQANLEISQTQLQETQANLEISQIQLQETQANLERSQTQLQETQANLERSQTQLQETQANLERSQTEQHQTLRKLKELQLEIQAMENSKFWKIRREWFKLKRALGIKDN